MSSSSEPSQGDYVIMLGKMINFSTMLAVAFFCTMAADAQTAGWTTTVTKTTQTQPLFTSNHVISCSDEGAAIFLASSFRRKSLSRAWILTAILSRNEARRSPRHWKQGIGECRLTSLLSPLTLSTAEMGRVLRFPQRPGEHFVFVPPLPEGFTAPWKAPGNADVSQDNRG